MRKGNLSGKGESLAVLRLMPEDVWLKE